LIVCGFAGYLGGQWQKGDAHAIENAWRMGDALAHRGPDDRGVWIDASCRYAVAHRRLAILDLSSAGRQPMVSESGRYVLAYNGEAYNHPELRAALEKEQGGGPAWKGHSDTETLLAAVESWGLEATLIRSVGMFALALWDRRERCLHLARDRMGEKPLYFGWCGGAFVFASELKALRRFPGFERRIDRDVLAAYLRFAYVPAPHSIFENVYKLQPGCMMRIVASAAGQVPTASPEAGMEGQGWRIRRYWSLQEHIPDAGKSDWKDERAALQHLEDTLQESVRSQQLSDVSLGAFLSGGIDSSLVVALMQAQSTQRVKTFTIGFDEHGYSEADDAQAVAEHLGTDHTELRLDPGQAMDVIPRLPQIYDEPFADSSQVPTFLVSQLARQSVTVALSGDAGDELFGGYNRHSWVPRIWRQFGWVPGPLRGALGATMAGFARRGRDGGAVERLLRERGGVVRAGEQLQKLGQRLQAADGPEGLYLALLSQWPDPGALVPGAREAPTLLAQREDWPKCASFAEQMMYLDAMTYLPDDILCKVDRAAMAVSLETRVPMLDHRVVSLAWRLPVALKIRGGQGKWALRQVLHKYVPRELVERPKQGFAIPLGQWLRGPLRDWAEELLAANRLQQEGFFDADRIRKAWELHLSGRASQEHALWTVLMFQSWLQAQERGC
jgi:asparagine synthase (glutamine-hydrolysing)